MVEKGKDFFSLYDFLSESLNSMPLTLRRFNIGAIQTPFLDKWGSKINSSNDYKQIIW